MTSQGYKTSPALQLMLHPGSVLKALQTLVLLSPPAHLKKYFPQSLPSCNGVSNELEEKLSFRAASGSSDKDDTVLLRQALTFSDRLDCKGTWKRTFQGAVKCCICKGWGENRLLSCQKGMFCARLSRAAPSKHPCAGNGQELSG